MQNSGSYALTARMQAKFEEARAFHRQGQIAQAQTLYGKLLEIRPDHADALHLLGVAAYQTGNHRKAVELIGKSIAIFPDNAVFHYNLGIALNELKELEAAAACFGKTVSLKPDYHPACLKLANTLQELNRFEAALASYDQAITIKPEEHLAHYGRANALKQLRRFEAAVASYDDAIALNPDHAESYSNRGNALQELKQFDAALASYDKAVSLQPEDHLAQFNRGTALQQLNKSEEALDCYDKAIAARPDFPDACWNKSLALLTGGNYLDGWPLYEWRWQVAKFAAARRNFIQRLWLGRGSLAGKTILLYSEQGLGDTIQFCRYIPLIAKLGARVVLEVDLPLTGLLKEITGLSAVFAKGSSLPESDFHCPLMSLPLAFKTEPNTIPCTRRYLKSDPEKSAQWKSRLGQKMYPFVGLVWSGNITHSNDGNRSVLLSDLIRHLPAGISYASLQKEVRDADRSTLASNAQILHLGDELTDFTDTAALCDLMDAVISVDTSVAHLNGALGNPTWLLLPFSPDWRWMLDREDSPWYPDLRLIRQQKPGDWSGAFEKLNSDLLAAYGKK
ncbi:MAG TPA: tetratricopeptide repeat protein [Chlorobaculum sp.]|nr:tetratricopeptide repeat protein [Chlorobaculum sp.]